MTEDSLSQDKGGTHGEAAGQSDRVGPESPDPRAAHQPFAERVLTGATGS